MNNVLFNKDNLICVDYNRDPFPFEIEVKNVNVDNVPDKQIPITVAQDKKDANGNQLYKLPQPDIETTQNTQVQTETTEVTNNPIMITVTKQVPLLDANGNQVTYEQTTISEVTTPTDNPVMIQYADGNLVQKKDANGNLLYYSQVGTGVYIKCYTTEETTEQKKDSNGNLLYYTTETVQNTISTPQDPLLITEDDERYINGLEKATEDVQQQKTISFKDSMNEFNYYDVIKYKESSITDGTFYGNGKLIETMDGVFLDGYVADLGFDFISFPSSGSAIAKVQLPSSASTIKVKTETNIDGLSIEIGDTETTLVAIDKDNEATLTSSVSEVYVSFKNTTNKRIDLYSFSLLI